MTEHDAELHGCWRLISFNTELQDSNDRTQPWGANPNRYLIFSSDGRMMVLVTAKTRERGNTDEKMVATVMAYTGQYRLDEDRFIKDLASGRHQCQINSGLPVGRAGF